MTLIYVSGPYTAPNENDVFNNILTARYIARMLWLKGYAVICPHLNTMLMGGYGLEHDDFMSGDLEILSRCDSVLMLPGWRDSVGAKIEYQKAVELGMTIYESLLEVPDEKSSR